MAYQRVILGILNDFNYFEIFVSLYRLIGVVNNAPLRYQTDFVDQVVNADREIFHDYKI